MTKKNKRLHRGIIDEYQATRFTLLISETDEKILNKGYKNYLMTNPLVRNKSAYVRHLINNNAFNEK